MQFSNTPQRYGVASAILYRLIVVVVYGMFMLGSWMVILNYYDGWYHQAPGLHKNTGILLMMELVIRVVWRLFSPPPAALVSYFRLTRIATAVSHLAPYLLLSPIVISGYLIFTADGKTTSVFGWFDVPVTLASAGSRVDLAGSLHLWLARVVVILPLLHGLITLKYHFADNDDTFNRMLGKPPSDYGV